MKSLILILCFSFFYAITVFAQEPEKPVMKKYTFVLLTKGPNRSHDSLEVQKIQKGHMDHIGSMAANGDLNIAGPFLDDGFYRGIFIFNTEDSVKVKKLVDEDPAVKSGRLAYEIHPWMTMQGSTFK
jgi:uncharacterized protein YciI